MKMIVKGYPLTTGETIGVTAVGLGLTALTKLFTASQLLTGTLLYFVGVLVGAKRPARGWLR